MTQIFMKESRTKKIEHTRIIRDINGGDSAIVTWYESDELTTADIRKCFALNPKFFK